LKTLSITGLCVLLSTAAMAQYGAGTVHGYGYDMYGSYRSYTADFATDGRMLWHRRGDIGVYTHRRPHGHAALNAY
jgi:hypothetical protein